MSTEISTLVLSAKDKFNSVLVDASMKFEAEAAYAIQALSSDYSQKLAMNNKQSVIDAVTNISAIGISLNPARKQAYLVPRDNKICLDISYMGLVDLAVQGGGIMFVQADIVYANDVFELRGFDEAPIHKYNPFSTDRGAIQGAYCVAKTVDGAYLTESMPISAIYDIRDRSSAWKAYKKNGTKCPWLTDETEMIKKTVIKRAYKLWPKASVRFQNAIDYLNHTDEAIDFAQEREVANTQAALPSEKVYYSQENFDKNINAWSELICSCKKTADEIIKTIETKGALLTDEQKNKIKAVGNVLPPDAQEFVNDMEKA